MSHISKIETKIKDLRFLKKACEALQMGCIETAEGNTLLYADMVKVKKLKAVLWK